jgi:hypothetical protein
MGSTVGLPIVFPWLSPTRIYLEAGIQSTLGCNVLKNCCNCAVVPGAEKKMLVFPFAPEHSCVGTEVGVGVTPLVTVPDFGVPLVEGVPLTAEDGLHWNSWLCERSGASDRLIEL